MNDRAIETGLSSVIDLLELVVLCARVISDADVGSGGLCSAIVVASEYIDMLPSLQVPNDFVLLLRRIPDPRRRSRAKVPDFVDAGEGM